MKSEPALATIVAPTAIESVLGELRELPTETLLSVLSETMQRTAECLVRMAAVVRLLEERGEDLSGLRLGLLGYLRRIAHGQLLPEIVVRFARNPALLGKLTSLPLPDQQRLADGQAIQLLVRRPGAPDDFRMVDPALMGPQELRQVFTRDGIRSPAEQAVLLDRLGDRKPKPTATTRIKTDRERGGIVVGRTFLSQGDVLTALSALSAESDDSPQDVPLLVKLTEAEHRAVKVKAAQSDTSMTDLIRRALRAAGLL